MLASIEMHYSASLKFKYYFKIILCMCCLCMFMCISGHVYMYSCVCRVEAKGWSDAVISQKYSEVPEIGRNHKKSSPEVFRKKSNLQPLV